MLLKHVLGGGLNFHIQLPPWLSPCMEDRKRYYGSAFVQS